MYVAIFSAIVQKARRNHCDRKVDKVIMARVQPSSGDRFTPEKPRTSCTIIRHATVSLVLEFCF